MVGEKPSKNISKVIFQKVATEITDFVNVSKNWSFF